MDVNNNNRINNQNIQEVSSQKSGEYIPALYAKTEDTVELSTSFTKKKKKGFIGNLVNKIRDLAQDVKASKHNQVSNCQEEASSVCDSGFYDEEPESIPERTIKDEVKDLLSILPIEDREKKYLLEDKRIEYMLPLLIKLTSIPDFEEQQTLLSKIGEILYYVETSEQAEVVDKFLSNSKLYENEYILGGLSNNLMVMPYTPPKANCVMKLFDKFLEDENLSNNNDATKQLFARLLIGVKDETQLEIANKILSMPEIYVDYSSLNFANVLVSLSDSSERIKIANKLLSIPDISKNVYLKNISASILRWVDSDEKVKHLEKIFSSPLLYENPSIKSYLSTLEEYHTSSDGVSFKTEILEKYLETPNLHQNEFLSKNISDIIRSVNNIDRKNIAIKFLSEPQLYENESVQNKITSVLDAVYSPFQAMVADKILSDPSLFENDNASMYIARAIFDSSNEKYAKTKLELLAKLLENPQIREDDFVVGEFFDFISSFESEETVECKVELVDLLLSDEEIKNDISQLGTYLRMLNTPLRITLAHKLIKNSDISKKEIFRLVHSIRTVDELEIKNKFIDLCLSESSIYSCQNFKNNFSQIVLSVCSDEHLKYTEKLFADVKTGELEPDLALVLIQGYGKVDYKQFQKLRKTVGDELLNTLAKSTNDIVIASRLVGLYNKNNINEISLAEKRNVLKALVQSNADLFSVSDELRKAFPLIPSNQEEYCAILPALVKSLGIEVKKLEEVQVEKFDETIEHLSSELAKLSDEDFSNLELSNSYSKDEFINDTLSIVSDLSNAERQKVYDYFGFELHRNKKVPTGFSIEGYPVNINNGAKLAQITDEKTKQVVETLREKVILFSEKNTIQSNNYEIATMVDEIMVALPELRSLIGKSQSDTYDFDLFKQSLKVMQKTVQNPSYQNLNESDKKIMLLASLLHDVNKAEGKPDITHPYESSFDVYYIAKKFNLSKEEQIKLYTLINHHEWLKYVNKEGLNPKEETKRLQSVAFDLQNDNLFEMEKILTEADLKSVKASDELYETYEADFELHCEKITSLIEELQKSKPILPTTTLPTADSIKEKITVINDDCSTNLKGVYVKDGLLVIKYNEVEDWESLGFPKGTVSKGIETVSPVDNSLINTGNIKFIAHGLTFANQLSNFDAFALPDSDALLSVSYMERPESKYRLFRTQGVLLDVDSKYIHGGGNTDAGSGCGKDISNFKSRYIFGGERQKDRDYISDLIKETLQLTDEEYVEFVKVNQNKSMLEIEPVEAREALIKKFALINSNKRRGDRAYNEMYVSNPKVQGCFAYSEKDDVGEISDFIDSQPEFLKAYAKENNLPFFVFGN